MNIELWKEGILLMIIGMGVVYFFISIMIVVMNLNSKILGFIGKYFPEKNEEDKPLPKKSNNNCDMEMALAIACAMAERGKSYVK